MTRCDDRSWELAGGQRTRVLCIVFLGVLLAWRMSIVVADPDLWAYMSFGRLLFETGQFPYRDTFSYLPTLETWVYHEWLTGVLFYKVYHLAGGPGLQIGKYLLGFTMFITLWKTMRREGAIEWAAVLSLGLAAIPFTLAFSPVRAQTFTNLFFAMTLYGLLRASRCGRFLGLLWLVPLQIAWANLHGGFVSGIGFLGLFALGELVARRRFVPYLAVAALCALATLVNPYGLDYWTYIVRAVGMARPNIPEWWTFADWMASPHGDPVMGISAVLLGVLSFVAFFGSSRRDACRLVLMIATAGLALSHVRHLPFFLMVGSVSLAVDLSGCAERWPAGSSLAPASRAMVRTFQAGVCIAIVFLGIRVTGTRPLTIGIPGSPAENRFYYPVGALEFLEARQIAGNMAVTFDWGSYVAWMSPERLKISYDGRYETVYTEETTRVNFDFWKGRGDWRRMLTKYPTDLVLLPRVGTSRLVLEYLAGNPDWTEIYRDDGAVLFRRTVPESR